MRISAPVLAEERAAALDALAKFSLTYTSPEKPDPFALLERISLTRVGVNADQENTWFTTEWRAPGVSCFA